MAENRSWSCKICGWQNLTFPHQGSVDCINQYRVLVEELRGLLPQGKQVMLATLTREATARLWIEGPITTDALSRLITLIEFMREAWTEDATTEETALTSPPPYPSTKME